MPIDFLVDLAANLQVKDLSLDVFDTGRIRVRGEAVSSLKSYHSKIQMDIPAYAIRHPEKGVILFGTGLSPDKKRRPQNILAPVLPYAFKYKQKNKEDIVTQLLNAGIAPEDVTTVILPYIGADTAGALDAFPGARVVVSAAEWGFRQDREEAGTPLSTVEIEKSNKNIDKVSIHSSPSFGSFENGKDLFGDGGLILVSLPGRSPGNMGLWINLPEGPVLLTGGAAYVVDNFLDRALPIKQYIQDLEEYWRSLHIIRAMRQEVPRLIVAAGNDLSFLKLTRRDDITIHKR